MERKTEEDSSENMEDGSVLTPKDTKTETELEEKEVENSMRQHKIRGKAE